MYRTYDRSYRSPSARRDYAAAPIPAANPEVDGAVWLCFSQDFPAEAKWIEDNFAANEFAQSLRRGVLRYGALTERQLAAVQRNLAPRPAAAAVNDAALRACFDRALASGLKRPVLRLDGVKVSPAPDTGKNPGALYVKAVDEAGTYLGKVLGGAFNPSRDCTPEQAAEVAALMSDPAAALDAYGKRTGNCGCCNRPLTAAESVERGIGPICAGRFGL